MTTKGTKKCLGERVGVRYKRRESGKAEAIAASPQGDSGDPATREENMS